MNEKDIQDLCEDLTKTFKLIVSQNPEITDKIELIEKALCAVRLQEYISTIHYEYRHLLTCEIHYTFPLNSLAKKS